MKNFVKFFANQEFLLIAKQNWLILPFIFFVLQITVYVFFFANNGQLAYNQKLKQVKRLEVEIKNLNLTIKSLQKKVKELKNDDLALKRFVREYLLYQGDVKIIKFLEEKFVTESKKKNLFSIKNLQFNYILYSSIVLIVILFVAFHFRKSSKYYDEK